MLDANGDKLLWQAYQEADRDLRVRSTKVGSILALILMPAGSSLDYFMYPELFWTIFQARVVGDLVLLPIFLLLFTQAGRRYVRVLSALWALTPMLCICWMIYVSEGSVSPYYAGLNLMVIAICQLLPYTMVEALLYCIAVIVAYLAACLLHGRGDIDTNQLFNNLYFIVLTAIICVTGCHYFTQRRIRDFRLRHELDLRNRQLTELDHLKSQFFANVSHELRTPLTLILSPVEALLSRRRPLPDGVQQALELVKQNGLRLLRLINDLLEIVRLEEGGLKLRRRLMRLDEFVRGMVESVRGLATHNQLTVEVVESDEPLTVSADESRMEKVLLNLLTNAIKFTPVGGAIKIRWWRDGDAAKVEVSDSGIGIAEHELPRIFDRFRQAANSAARQYQGLGLGLALAKELIEEHGGRLTATSQLGSGSSFLLELPLALAEDVSASQQTTQQDDEGVLPEMFRAANRAALAVDPASSQLTTSGSGTTRILIVDDEPDMRRFLASTLSEEFTVMQAADGESGLDLAVDQLPKLVLLDLMLPGINGLEVCRSLRADERTRDVKVLMLTARIDEQSKIAALECGVDDFLTKPFSTVEVKTRIKNLLAAAALQDDLRFRNQELSDTLARLRSTEAQLVQSEKMNALGSLAAGLLHEINNPLNYTLMAVQSVKMSADPNDKDLAETVVDIEDGMKRIRDIVSDLRAFAYPEQMDKQEPFEIQDAVKTALRFTAQELSGVEIESDLVNGVRVVGSRTHVTQVLVNLVTNAAHAVESVRQQRPPKIRIAAESQNGRLYVRVRDNGVGIEPKLLSRIFDPFFTTRDVGQGTGLGLSICHTIIQNHGGRIEARSETGNWTELTFDLPLYKSEAQK
jgi:signal transduction histidine kinase